VSLSEDKKDKRTKRAIANERLEAALLRLERAVAKTSEAENSEYLERIAVLVKENNKLKNTNGIIESRLNGAIKKLKNLLKES